MEGERPLLLALSAGPVRITSDVARQLDALSELAPLHNPPALTVVRAANEDEEAVGVASRITTASSRVTVDVVPVDEEVLIAERVRDSLPVASPAAEGAARSAS